MIEYKRNKHKQRWISLSLVEMAKKRLQVTVREDIVEWVDQQVDKLRFASRSHAIEYALLQLINEKKEE